MLIIDGSFGEGGGPIRAHRVTVRVAHHPARSHSGVSGNQRASGPGKHRGMARGSSGRL